MVFKTLIDKISQLRKNQGFLKYFKNTSWLFTEKILRLISAIVIGSLIARYLGPSDFGVLNYALSFVVIFTPLTTLGLENIMVRDLVQEKDKKETILGTAFGLRVGGSFLLILTLLFVFQFITIEKHTSFYIIIIAFSYCFQSFDIINFFFQSKVLSKYAVFSGIFMLIISAFVKLFLIYSKATLVSFVYVILLDAILVAIGLIFFYFKIGQTIKKWSFDFSIAKRLLSDSWPLLLSGIFVIMYMRIDQIMIKEMLGNEAVGNYVAAVKLSEAWYFVPVVIVSSLFPAILNSKKINEKIYYNRIQKLFNLLTRIAIVIAILVTFLSDWVIHFLYGVDYLEASMVLKVHIWSSVFVFFGVVSSKWFVIENMQKIAFLRTSIGLLINIIANLYFIQKYGIVGAAISTLLSQMMATYIFDLFHAKTRKIFIMKSKSMLLFYK